MCSWEWGGKKKGSQQAPIVTDDDRIDEDVDVDEDEDKDEDQDGGVSL